MAPGNVGSTQELTLVRQVEAVTKSQGGEVEYPETIVYREDAILPSVVVVYTRH